MACPVARTPAVAAPFSAAVGELQNDALGTREGEPTHAIVEAHPIRAEPLLSADNNRAVHQKKGPRAVWHVIERLMTR